MQFLLAKRPGFTQTGSSPQDVLLAEGLAAEVCQPSEQQKWPQLAQRHLQAAVGQPLPPQQLRLLKAVAAAAAADLLLGLLAAAVAQAAVPEAQQRQPRAASCT